MNILNYISSLILPLVISVFALILLSRKKDYTSVFINGAREGIKSSFSILPTLCLLIVGVSMFTASGATEIMSKMLSPLFDFLKIPVDLLPLIVTRPLSSGASIAVYEELVQRCGIDSFEVLCGSIIMASTDTVFYVVGVYFSTTRLKTRYTIPCALLTTVFCIFISCAICRIFFE